MPFHSNRKKTALGDTAFEGEITGEDKFDIVEIPIVGNAVGGRQDDNKSHQGSPVTMEHSPDNPLPSNEKTQSLFFVRHPAA